MLFESVKRWAAELNDRVRVTNFMSESIELDDDRYALLHLCARGPRLGDATGVLYCAGTAHA